MGQPLVLAGNAEAPIPFGHLADDTFVAKKDLGDNADDDNGRRDSVNLTGQNHVQPQLDIVGQDAKEAADHQDTGLTQHNQRQCDAFAVLDVALLLGKAQGTGRRAKAQMGGQEKAKSHNECNVKFTACHDGTYTDHGHESTEDN